MNEPCAILKSGVRYSMREQLWCVYTLNRGWVWSSDLMLGDVVHLITNPELDDEVVGFTIIEDVMNS